MYDLSPQDEETGDLDEEDLDDEDDDDEVQILNGDHKEDEKGTFSLRFCFTSNSCFLIFRTSKQEKEARKRR